jgi:2-isopropylmalate synthase
LGYSLDEDQIDIVFAAMKKLADRKKEIFIEDLEAVVMDEIFRIPDKFRLEYLSAISGNMSIPNAVIKMYVDGEERTVSDFGTGPIDAVFNTIAKVVGRHPSLARYSVNAITGGTDAQGEVTVKLQENGKTAVGRASDADIIVASAKAYLNALNRLVKREEDMVCAKL